MWNRKLERTSTTTATTESTLSQQALSWLIHGGFAGRPPAGMCEGSDRAVLVALEARDNNTIRKIVAAHRAELDAFIARHQPARNWTRDGRAYFYFELFA